MPTTISDLWIPDIWLATMREKQATFPSLLNSGVVVDNPKASELASGPGEVATIPFFKDITDQDDEIQVENAEPAVDNKITSGQMKAVACNRVTKSSATAFSAQLSGEDPVGEISAQMVQRRLKQRQKTLLAMVRGAFGSAGASGIAAPLQDVRVDSFDETGDDATAAQLMGVELFINAKSLMGELADDLMNGALWVHPTVLASLELADETSFDKASHGPWTIRTYRGIPIYVSESLVRPGTTNGFVYETYLLANGVVAKGEKPQKTDVVDVAALQMEKKFGLNNEIIYDRTRFVLHLNGMKWVGTPAAESPSNAELGTIANWNLVLTTANRVGAVCIRTNG
ncbi:MAG: hypothetical protein ACFHW5_11795 [Verrucomicrobiota bacterium]